MRRDFRLVAGASLWEDKSVAVIPDRGENDAPLLSGGREALDGSSVGKGGVHHSRSVRFYGEEGQGESRRGGEKGELTLLLWLFYAGIPRPISAAYGGRKEAGFPPEAEEAEGRRRAIGGEAGEISLFISKGSEEVPAFAGGRDRRPPAAGIKIGKKAANLPILIFYR